jgi:hypothetical protein
MGTLTYYSGLINVIILGSDLVCCVFQSNAKSGSQHSCLDVSLGQVVSHQILVPYD